MAQPDNKEVAFRESVVTFGECDWHGCGQRMIQLSRQSDALFAAVLFE